MQDSISVVTGLVSMEQKSCPHDYADSDGIKRCRFCGALKLPIEVGDTVYTTNNINGGKFWIKHFPRSRATPEDTLVVRGIFYYIDTWWVTFVDKKGVFPLNCFLLKEKRYR